MAPFALVAPVIGPVLDRFQHGRRVAMATSAFGRALLAILMAQNFDNLYALFPLALGSLVLSKAYSVVRAAAAPRLVPTRDDAGDGQRPSVHYSAWPPCSPAVV